MNKLALKVMFGVTATLAVAALTGCPSSSASHDPNSRKIPSVVGVWKGHCTQDSSASWQVGEIEFLATGDAQSREAYFTDSECQNPDVKRSSDAFNKQALGSFKVVTRFPHARGTITIDQSPSPLVYTYEIFEKQTAEKLMLKSQQTGHVEYFTRVP